MSEAVSSPRRNNALQNSAFICQIASYVGLVPEEKSGGDLRRQGDISKQGNLLLRFLLVEAAQVTVLSHLEWRSRFFHVAMRRGRKTGKFRGDLQRSQPVEG